MSDYQLPEVWEAPSQMGGAWGGLNQPTAGARFEQTLQKATSLSNSIPFQPKWDQGDHYAGRIKRAGSRCRL